MDENTQGGISGFGLKMIALVTMLIDHIGAVVLYNWIYVDRLCPPESLALWDNIYFAVRLIGRMAFPIYCFLLVEGLVHTRSKAKYALRLLLFAVISEVPFDLALAHTALEFAYQNVFFTLFVGMLAIWAMDEIGKKMLGGLPIWQGKLMVFAVALGASAIAEFLLHSDYGAYGVITIIIIYLMRDRNRMIGYAVSVILLGLFLDITEFAALAITPLIGAYSGQRGRQVKYLFYVFYPVHLLILVGICRLMGL